MPTTLDPPAVMPRPIHLTLLGVAADLDLVARLALDVEEIVEAALPLAQVDRQRADRVVRRASAMTSGESASASSGTFGCSLRVSVIMLRPRR